MAARGRHWRLMGGSRRLLWAPSTLYRVYLCIYTMYILLKASGVKVWHCYYEKKKQCYKIPSQSARDLKILTTLYIMTNLLHKCFVFLLENLSMKGGWNLTDPPPGIMDEDEWNVWNFDESFCYQYLATMIWRLAKYYVESRKFFNIHTLLQWKLFPRNHRKEFSLKIGILISPA